MNINQLKLIALAYLISFSSICAMSLEEQYRLKEQIKQKENLLKESERALRYANKEIESIDLKLSKMPGSKSNYPRALNEQKQLHNYSQKASMEIIHLKQQIQNLENQISSKDF